MIKYDSMDTHTYTLFRLAHEAWDAAYEACEDARSSIHFENFILRDDALGRKFIELFKRKAREGVIVKVLLDSIGSAELLQLHLDNEITEAGGELIFFNSVIPGTLSHYTPWFFRDHRKLIVVDGKTAFTGGVCFQEHMREWRDTAVRIEGLVVAEMERSFLDMWRYAKKEGPLPRSRALPRGEEFSFLGNAPLRGRRALYLELLARVASAKRTVLLTTPYFVPTLRLSAALRRAARRGVDVRLLVPLYSDMKLNDIATESHFTSLLKTGIEVLRYTPDVVHTKAAVIDGWATLGSLNLDNLSLRYNFEANLCSEDAGFVAALEKQFEDDATESQHLMLEQWRKRPLYAKFLELLVRPFRFLL